MTLKSLQNGSDIRGIAISTDEHTANLIPQAVTAITAGLLNWLLAKHDLTNKWQARELTIAVGRDSRLSGPELADSFIKAARQQGVNVIDMELATTPSMFMATQYPQFAADAGVMFTASHLPYYFNGIKIFTKAGGAEHEDIAYILEHTQALASDYLGTLTKADILTPYAADLVEKIRQGCGLNTPTPLQGLHLVVDAGNGAGGFFVDKVLKELGADTTGSQFLEPDGNFPNHIPNPENQEAIDSIKEAVLANQADLGIIFDTDVDRSAVVTKDGQLLNRSNFIAILSYIALSEYPNSSIVTNSLTSDHVKSFIQGLGGQQIRYISGYRNIINRAIKANKEGIDSPLAVETSGHAAFRENYFLDDGTYAAAKILMLMPKLHQAGKELGSLIANLKQPAEAQEVRFKLEVDDFKQYGRQVIADLAQADITGFTFNPENEEGVRFILSDDYGKGWFLLRMSLHEPFLVLNAETETEGYVTKVLATLHDFLNQYEHVNQANLTALLS